MSLSEIELKAIFLDDDIFPIGEFEALKIHTERDGNANSYFNVCLLKENIDFQALLQEAHLHIQKIGKSYVLPRLQFLNKKIDEMTLRDLLHDVGFRKDSYQSYSLRKLGTCDLENWVLGTTKFFFEQFPNETFRQQYAVAEPGWHTKLHKDHSHFRKHGFRVMVPLSADVYMGFEDEGGRNRVYRLKRGGMYFVNIAKMHRGFNESLSAQRINLIFQMNSDRLIINSKEVVHLQDSEISLLPIYSREYQYWRFGVES